MKTILALLLSLSTASASLHTIYVDGEFRQQTNAGYFGLALPIPFHFVVQYDDEAVDTNPLPTVGIYETEGAYWFLQFGSDPGFFFFGANTEVRVWNDPASLKMAIGFGNEDYLSQYGLSIDGYRVYALFPNLFYPVTGWDDSLHQVRDHAGDYRFELLSYVYIFGHEFTAWAETALETTTMQHYTVQ